MSLAYLLVIGAVVGILVAMVIRVVRRGSPRDEEPLRILERRYAAGAIDRENSSVERRTSQIVERAVVAGVHIRAAGRGGADLHLASLAAVFAAVLRS